MGGAGDSGGSLARGLEGGRLDDNMAGALELEEFLSFWRRIWRKHQETRSEQMACQEGGGRSELAAGAGAQVSGQACDGG